MPLMSFCWVEFVIFVNIELGKLVLKYIRKDFLFFFKNILHGNYFLTFQVIL